MFDHPWRDLVRDVDCVAANSLANPRRLLKSLPPALYEVGAAVVVALTLFPQLAESIGRVRRARRLRGDTGRNARALRAVVIPVMEDALERSMRLAASMDARGYGRKGAAGRRSRTLSGALLLVGLMGVCVGVYATADLTAPRLLAAPVLVTGFAVAGVGFWLSGRTVGHTRYRPDPWHGWEWVTAGCGVVAAAAFFGSYELDAVTLGGLVVALAGTGEAFAVNEIVLVTAPDDELAKAKNYITLGFPSEFETIGDLSAHLEEMIVYPDVPPVLEELRQEGVRLGILSNRGQIPEENVNEALEHAGLLPFFDRDLILYGPKDSPRLFEQAAARVLDTAGTGSEARPTLLFVGEDATERAQARAADFLVAPHPRLALTVLRQQGPLRYLRIRIPPAFADTDWQAELRDQPLLPLHRSAEPAGGSTIEMYAIADAPWASPISEPALPNSLYLWSQHRCLCSSVGAAPGRCSASSRLFWWSRRR